MIVAFIADIVFIALTLFVIIGQMVYPKYKLIDYVLVASIAAFMMALVTFGTHLVVASMGNTADAPSWIFLFDAIKIVSSGATVMLIDDRITNER